MKKYIFIALIFSLFLNISCVTDETCIQTKYVKLTANFYLVNPNATIVANRITGFYVDSITVQGLKYDSITKLYHPVDSILYTNRKVNSINLPLSNNSTVSIFKLKFKNVVDTMTIYHSNINDYISLECGCIITHAIDNVTTTNHYIDSARIKIHEVNTINAENIRIYKDTTKINKATTINAEIIRLSNK
jgi:hypothetical protein